MNPKTYLSLAGKTVMLFSAMSVIALSLSKSFKSDLPLVDQLSLLGPHDLPAVQMLAEQKSISLGHAISIEGDK